MLAKLRDSVNSSHLSFSPIPITNFLLRAWRYSTFGSISLSCVIVRGSEEASPMNENDYLQQVANLAGLRHYPQQGTWSKKSGSAVATRDGYVTAVGISRDRQGAKVVVLLRFKKLEQ